MARRNLSTPASLNAPKRVRPSPEENIFNMEGISAVLPVTDRFYYLINETKGKFETVGIFRDGSFHMFDGAYIDPVYVALSITDEGVWDLGDKVTLVNTDQLRSDPKYTDAYYFESENFINGEMDSGMLYESILKHNGQLPTGFNRAPSRHVPSPVASRPSSPTVSPIISRPPSPSPRGKPSNFNIFMKAEVARLKAQGLDQKAAFKQAGENWNRLRK